MTDDSIIQEAGAPQPPPTAVVERPTNASELVAQIGCDPKEGVIVALLTEPIERVTTRLAGVLDKKGRPMYLMEAEIFAWGTRVLDLIGEGNEQIKWWRVKQAADIGKGQMVPVRWEGPISEIPEKYFEQGRTLMIRFYRSGPAFFPLEKPVIRDEEAEKLAMEAAALAAQRS